MTFSASDLLCAIDRQLTELGYEIFGDDNDGWSWRYGAGPAAEVAKAARLFDSAAEAIEAAIRDLVGCIDDILGTGQTVIDRWSTGDLAEAVRELDEALRTLDSTAEVAQRREARAQRRAARLRRLIAEGLSFDDCVEAFGTRSLDDARIRSAVLALDGEAVQVMDRSVVRADLGQPGQAHALVWLRIDGS